MIVKTTCYLVLGLLLWGSYDTTPVQADHCEDARKAAETATALLKTTQYDFALKEIQTAFARDHQEHVVAFGRDDSNHIITSQVNSGRQTNGNVPRIAHAFADLHNHPGNHPPDAGDLYGLIDINQRKRDYNTRFVITQNQTVYALVITNPTEADAFNIKYPRDLSGCNACSPKFPEAIVDEFREMKYANGCTDEMALAFILEKYNAGISLLKQPNNKTLIKLRTSMTRTGNNISFTPNNCP